MAHIAVITSGLTGILHSSFEVVSRLQAEGNRVTYLCPFDVRTKVENKGITYVQLPQINFHYWSAHNKLLLSWPSRVIHYFKNLKTRNALGKSTLKINEFQDALSAIAPDSAIIDVELHELIYSAHALGIPFNLLSPWFPNIRTTNVPPITSGIVPGIGFRGSEFGISMLWIWNKVKASVKQGVSCFMLKNYRRSVLKNYAKELNIPSSSLGRSSFPPLFHYKEWPTLHMVLKEMDFPQKDFSSSIYVGPMVFNKRDHSQEKADPELLNIFESRRKGGRKIIYCSVSTLDRGDDTFVKKVIRAVQNQQDWVLIISLGGKLKITNFGNVPENVYLKEWVPQLQVLQNTDCSINHAGINTINECIHFKVPMLVYSGKRHDQNGCAARVTYHQIGLVGDKDLDTNEHIKNKINTLLTEPVYLLRLKEMNEKYELTKNRSLSHLL